MIEISATPAEKGTAKVTVGPFTDEDGTAVTPLSITWVLTDRSGTVINNRAAVVVTPAATVIFALTGDDLGNAGNALQRVLTVSWTYNSTLGNGLTGRAQAKFSIEQMVGIADA